MEKSKCITFIIMISKLFKQMKLSFVYSKAMKFKLFEKSFVVKHDKKKLERELEKISVLLLSIYEVFYVYII